MQKIRKRLRGAATRQTIRDYVSITVGALLLAAAVNIFLLPNQVVSLGFTGLAMLANYLWSWPMGIVLIILNVPVMLAGIKWGGGWRFLVRTIYAVMVMSAAIDLLAPILPAIQSDPLIYTLFGGMLNGLGAGLILRGQGTGGGTDIIALLLNRYRGIPFGQLYLISNAVTLLGAAAVVGLVPALYALIVIFVSSKVLDTIQEGVRYARSVFIISAKPAEVQAAIIEELNRGVTVLSGEGGYTHTPRPLLFVVVSRSQLSRLKRRIAEIDPTAFVVVSEANEVLGQGFHPVQATAS